MREVWDHRGGTADDEHRQWAAADGTVIVETCSSAGPGTTLTALDVATGDVRWRRACPPLGVNQAMAVAGGLLVVLHPGQRAEARGYDAATGAELWAHPLTGEPRGVAMLGQEVVIVAGSSVRKLGRDGRLAARTTLSGSALTTVAVTDDGDVVTTNGRGRQNILRLSGDTLAVRWDVRVPGEQWTYRHTPLVTRDSVYFHSYSLWAMAVDVATGEVRWRRKKAAGRGGVVLHGPDGSVLWGTDGVTRVRSRDGKALWRTPRVIAATGTGDPARVVIARRADVPYAFAPAEGIDVRVELLDATTGGTVGGVGLVDVRRNWVDGDMSGRLFTVIDGMLVSGLETGRVRAFRPATATVDS
ncbi:PQQ-binding-like beta-propeller repeat protein [Actinophytocola sp. NPDC049390]|uniref:outer membrane protein assembly factor BamB family protein n=1 Tax=Actinophytocola sp. NPDC049390 TaxID=3363894 RepID=UPI00379E480A